MGFREIANFICSAKLLSCRAYAQAASACERVSRALPDPWSPWAFLFRKQAL